MSYITIVHYCEYGELIEVQKVALLSKIVKETNTAIVLHSAWRFWFNDNLQPVRKEAENLIELFRKFNISIYGKWSLFLFWTIWIYIIKR